MRHTGRPPSPPAAAAEVFTASRAPPAHRAVPNGGPAVKVNANQRYATDAPGAAAFLVDAG